MKTRQPLSDSCTLFFPPRVNEPCSPCALHVTEKHRGFGFITFEEREDAKAAIENMNNSELYGRVLRVNIAKPQRAKAEGSGKAVWADEHANKFFEKEDDGVVDDAASLFRDDSLKPDTRHRHPGQELDRAPGTVNKVDGAYSKGAKDLVG